jgi:hypothetical protein
VRHDLLDDPHAERLLGGDALGGEEEIGGVAERDASPLTAAIIGLAVRPMPNMWVISTVGLVSASREAGLPRSIRSEPEQNARSPAPVTMPMY